MQMTQAKLILITISMLFVQPCAKVTIYHFPLQWVLPTLCLRKKGPTLKRYSSKLYGSILMIFGRNIQKSLE